MSERVNKKQKSIIVFIAIIIVISTLAIVKYTEKTEGITAMEALEYSNAYAHEWNEDGELFNMGVTDYSVPPHDIDGEEGRYNEWFCLYGVPTDNGANTSSILFKVYSNGTVIEQGRTEDSNLFEYRTGFVSNWTIDSDEAYDIAMGNSDVLNWLEEHPDAKLNFFNINHVDYMDYTALHIMWIDKSDSNYGYISAFIVADTGEITVRVT